MNQILIGGVISFFVSILAAAIIELFKNRKKDFSISYEFKKHSRYKPQEKGDLKISISYKNKDVESSLQMFTIELVNSGKKDVFHKNQFVSGIYISHPKLDIIDAKVDCDSISKPAISIDDKGRAYLTWEILKPGEAITVNLAALEHEQDTKETIKVEDYVFEFRADSINKLNRVKQPHRKYFTWMSICMAILTTPIILYVFSRQGVVMDITYNGEEYDHIALVYDRVNKVYYDGNELFADKVAITDIDNVVINSMYVDKSKGLDIVLFVMMSLFYLLIIPSVVIDRRIARTVDRLKR